MKNQKQNDNNTSGKKTYFYIFLAFIIVAGIIISFIFLNPFNEDNEDIEDIFRFGGQNTLEKPIINYDDGQVVELQDLNITWQECENADKYIYNIIILAGQPNYDDENEASLKNAVGLSENTDGTAERTVYIPKDKLKKGRWVKIAVAACNEDNQLWSLTYIYINTQGGANTRLDIYRQQTAPVTDGNVDRDEYSEKIHSVDYNSAEFISAYDTDKSINADFYMCYDRDHLYAAWVVRTDGHWPVGDCDNDGNFGTQLDLSYMWQFSSVQFMLCNGEPDKNNKKFQTSQWNGDYLEVGLSLLENGESAAFIYSTPTGYEGFSTEDMGYCVERDQESKTTTYEVKIPWEKIGIDSIEHLKKVGFSYAIADQQDFYAEPNMAEWQDAILGIKNMDAGAVITLK